MFGWEFPPYSSGGLGTACHGLTKGLHNHGVEVLFVIPSCPGEIHSENARIIVADDLKGVKLIAFDSPLCAYMTSAEYKNALLKGKASKGKSSMYGSSLFEEVYRYSEFAKEIARMEGFDVIHAHDWLTYMAGLNARKVSGKPLVVHVHATEFDRSPSPNPAVYNIEREGMHEADVIIAVSNYTKNKIVEHYGVPPDKIRVVHNAVEFSNEDSHFESPFKDNDKIVLFLGRLTFQKGPDHFLYAAKRVLEVERNVKFVIAGSGDMERFIIEKAAELGLANHVLFTGFLKGRDVDKAYKMADLYVVPSVSEPFGITPLEAMRNGTPVLISKQSGVSEVISHCLKADFWDRDEMANKIIAVLRYGELHHELSRNGFSEVRRFNWDEPAQKCMDVYNEAITMGG